MAVTLLRVLVLGVIAAAADDVPITWWSPPRASLSCVVPEAAERLPARRPPPPLKADDRPKAKQPYLWRRGEEELKRVQSNGTLDVSRKKDGSSEGVYQCAVRHHAGVVLGYPLRLKFAYLDKQFSVHPANATAVAGQPFVLSCAISSGPAAIVSWQRDGEPLPSSDRYYTLKNQLLILDVRNEDAGLYRCKATNPHANRTRVSHGGRLQVEEYSSELEVDPAILPVQYDENIAAPRGETVVLPCPVTGYPRPKLIWEFTPPGQRTGELEHTDEVLTLPRLDLDQEGVYTCNIEGHSDLVKTFTVLITVPVNITVPPTSKHVVRASTVRFNCTAVGQPTPTITWYKDGRLLPLSGRIEVRPSANHDKRMELLIRSVAAEDAGIYQCFASNGHSWQSRWAWLNVTGAGAAPPAAVACAPLAARHVLVRWDAIDNTIAYTVHISQPGGKSLPSQPILASEGKITLTDALTPYRFQVQAFILSPLTGKNVASDMSESVTCQGQGVPIKFARTGDRVLISWKQFFRETPGVQEWILQYRNENSTHVHNVTLGPDVYNYTITSVPSSSVQVRVLGTRQLPWLQQNLTLVPWMSGLNVSDGEVTAKIEDVKVSEVGARELTVQWRCDEAEGSADTYVYLVCFEKLDDDEQCIETYDTWVKLVGLSPVSEYSVRVKARVPALPHLITDFTQPIHVSTGSEGPDRIKDLTYKVINGSTLRVSWNSVPDKYTVYYNSVPKLPIHEWPALRAVGNTVLITGVDLSKELYVMVSGYQPVGQSPVLHIPVLVPEAKDLEYSFTRDGVSVTWKGAGARVVRYSQNLSQPLEKWNSIDVTGNVVNITGLESSLQTYVTVAAPGQHSATQILTIPFRLPDHEPTSHNAKGVDYSFTKNGITLSWKGERRRTVRYSQNLTQPLDKWSSINVTGEMVEIVNLEASLQTYVMVVTPGQPSETQILTLPVRPPDDNSLLLSVGLGVGVLLLCVLAAAAICIWHKRKKARSPVRSRRRNVSSTGHEEEGAEMKNIGPSQMANGGGSKDAGEPLLNGHVHITENPNQSKTPNGRMRKGRRYEPTFDVARYEDPDSTLETVLDDSSSTTFNLLDTSRRPEFNLSRSSQNLSANNSFNKLPDDNMNSELTRSTDFQLDNSKILPTLQPNG